MLLAISVSYVKCFRKYIAIVATPNLLLKALLVSVNHLLGDFNACLVLQFNLQKLRK